MKDDDLIKKLPDYLKGSLPKTQRQEYERLVAKSPHRKEIESLHTVWHKLRDLTDPEPDTTMTIRFQAMLEAYKEGQANAGLHPTLSQKLGTWLQAWWPKQPQWQFALSVAVLIAGFFLGYASSGGPDEVDSLRSEVYGLRQLVATSLLQSSSPSERLRGVGYSFRFEHPDDKTLNVLLNTLNYDPNLNVRLAAVDAVSLFYGREMIRRGVMESLTRQTAPLLQVALIDLLVKQEERHSLEILQMLSKNQDINEAVRNRAGQAIEQLQRID